MSVLLGVLVVDRKYSEMALSRRKAAVEHEVSENDVKRYGGWIREAPEASRERWRSPRSSRRAPRN